MKTRVLTQVRWHYLFVLPLLISQLASADPPTGLTPQSGCAPSGKCIFKQARATQSSGNKAIEVNTGAKICLDFPTDNVCLTSTSGGGIYVLKAGDTMTGSLLMPDGNQFGPALAFSNEAGTGFYRPGANQLTVAINTANVCTFVAGGLKVVPAGTLSVTACGPSADTTTGFNFPGGNNIDLVTGGTLRWEVTNTGQLAGANGATLSVPGKIQCTTGTAGTTCVCSDGSACNYGIYSADSTHTAIRAGGTDYLSVDSATNGTISGSLSIGGTGTLATNAGAKFGQVTEQTYGVVPTSKSSHAYGSMQWATHQFAAHPGNSRRTGYGTILTTSDTSITVVGMSAITNLGTPTSAPATDTNRNLIQYATGAVSGNTAGWVGPLTQSRMSYHPAFSAVVRTDSAAVTSTRIFVGLTAADLSGFATLAASNTTIYCALRYDTGLSDTTWQACSSDGTTASCTDTTVAVAAATTYKLHVDHSSDGNCEYAINGVVKVTKSSNISLSSTQNIGPQVEITTLTTAARNLFINRFALEHD